MKKLLLILSIFMSLMLSAEYSHAQYQDNNGNNNSATYITVSPNPFDNELTVTIHEGNKKVSYIRIFDLIGKEVAVIDLRNKSGNFTYRIDFSKLRPGVYFCNVYSETGLIETKKVFKTSDQ